MRTAVMSAPAGAFAEKSTRSGLPASSVAFDGFTVSAAIVGFAAPGTAGGAQRKETVAILKFVLVPD
jgi:hypothetical protein